MMMYVLLAALFLGTLVDDSTQLYVSRKYHGYGYGYYWPRWTTPTLRNIKMDDAFYRYLEAVSREAITNLRKARLTTVQSTYAHRYTVSGDANDANLHFYNLRPKNVRYRYRSRRYSYRYRVTYHRYKRDVSDDGHRAKRNIIRTWRNFRKANYRTYGYKKFRKNYWRKGYRTKWYRKKWRYGRRKWYRRQHKYGRRTRHSRYRTRRIWMSSTGGTLVTTGVVGRYYVTLSTSKYSSKLTFVPLRYYRGWFSDTVRSRIYTYSKRTGIWNLLRNAFTSPRYTAYSRLRHRQYKPRRTFLGKVKKAFGKFKRGRKLKRHRKFRRSVRRRKFGRRRRRGKRHSRRHRRRRGKKRRQRRKRRGGRRQRRRYRRRQ